MDSADEYYYTQFIDTDDDSSDDDTEIIMVVAAIVSEIGDEEGPKYVGSLPGRGPALDRDKEAGQMNYVMNYVITPPEAPPV